MASATLTGDDTIKLNGRVLADLADGEVGKLTYPNDLAAVKTGKNGNSLYAFNNTGKQGDLELRITRGSADDKFLLNIINQMKNNFAGFVLMTGEFTKNVGDGNGNITSDTYLMSGGVPIREIDTSSNAEGNTDQSMALYRFKFANAPRSIG